jgi:hypothetical protein
MLNVRWNQQGKDYDATSYAVAVFHATRNKINASAKEISQ